MSSVQLIAKITTDLNAHKQISTHPFDSGNFIIRSNVATVERVEMFNYQPRVMITISLIPTYVYVRGCFNNYLAYKSVTKFLENGQIISQHKLLLARYN